MEISSSPWKDQSASCNLEERFVKMVKFSSPGKIARIDEWLEENKRSHVKPKKKNSRDPSLMSPVMTSSLVNQI